MNRTTKREKKNWEEYWNIRNRYVKNRVYNQKVHVYTRGLMNGCTPGVQLCHYHLYNDFFKNNKLVYEHTPTLEEIYNAKIFYETNGIEPNMDYIANSF